MLNMHDWKVLSQIDVAKKWDKRSWWNWEKLEELKLVEEMLDFRYI
jgi:hypothetical protein